MFIQMSYKENHMNVNKPGELSPLQQGDIIWLNTGPVEGSEQDGFRPAVVVSHERANRTGLVLVVPITSQTRRSSYPLNVKLESLDKDSYALTQHIKSFDLIARRYEEKAQKVTESELAEILGKLKALMF